MTTGEIWPLKLIYAYLTEGCNLKCRHCYVAPKFETSENPQGKLNPEILFNVIRQAKPMGLSSVKLTGGEPLMHDEILTILDYIIAERIHLQIETNGVCCTEEIAERISIADKAHCAVSLDSSDKEIHEWIRGVPGCFEKTITGIKNLVQRNVHTQIITCLNRKNLSHVNEIVKLAEDLGASSLKFNVINPIERGKTLLEKNMTLPIRTLIETGRWIEDKVAQKSTIKIFFHYPVVFRSVERIMENTCSPCAVKNVIGLLPSGEYALCGVGYSTPGLVFGDAETHKLNQVWETSEVLQNIRAGIPKNLEGVCADCFFKLSCCGHCVAQNYYDKKNLFAPFWFCSEAYKAGLFPGQRLKPRNSDV